MFFPEKQKSSQRKIHKSPAKQFIEIPLKIRTKTIDCCLLSVDIKKHERPIRFF